MWHSYMAFNTKHDVHIFRLSLGLENYCETSKWFGLVSFLKNYNSLLALRVIFFLPNSEKKSFN